MHGRNSITQDEMPGTGARPVLGLAGKVSQMVEMVVCARFGFAMPNGRYPWQVVRGDTGILQFKRHKRYARFVELLVIWDNDPGRKARRAILSSLEVIGVQTGRNRVTISHI